MVVLPKEWNDLKFDSITRVVDLRTFQSDKFTPKWQGAVDTARAHSGVVVIEYRADDRFVGNWHYVILGDKPNSGTNCSTSEIASVKLDKSHVYTFIEDINGYLPILEREQAIGGRS
jgi:hypothetical protein